MEKSNYNNRLKNIFDALLEFEKGDHSARVKLSGNSDDLDALSLIINKLLGNFNNKLNNVKSENQEIKKIVNNPEESETRLKFLFEATSELITLCDEKAQVLWANKSWSNHFGADYGAIDNPFEPIHPEDVQKVTKEWSEMIAGKNKIKNLQYRFKIDSHKYKTFSTSVYPVNSMNKQLYYLVATDITKFKQIEKELNIRNKLSNIFLTVSDDKLYSEILQTVLDVTGSKHGVFGYVKEEYSSDSTLNKKDIVWSQCNISYKGIAFEREKWQGIWNQSLLKNKIHYSSESSKLQNKQIAHTRALNVPILNNNLIIGKLLVSDKETDYTIEDIKFLKIIADYIAPLLSSKLKNEMMEKKLENSRELFRNFVNESQDFFVILDSEFKILDTKIHESFPLKREECLGKSFLDVVPSLKKTDRFEKYKEVIATGKSAIFEDVVYSELKDKYFVVKAFKINEGLGIVATDVTDKKDTEKKLENYYNDLEKSVSERTSELEEANITLKNVLSHIEAEKMEIKERVSVNIEKNVLPIIEKLKTKKNLDSKIIMLEESVKNITEGFYNKLIHQKLKLTPTEIRICKLVKEGYLAKEIAEMENLAYSTIRDYKKKIRKKLGLQNSAINLKTYLNEYF